MVVVGRRPTLLGRGRGMTGGCAHRSGPKPSKDGPGVDTASCVVDEETLCFKAIIFSLVATFAGMAKAVRAAGLLGMSEKSKLDRPDGLLTQQVLAEEGDLEESCTRAERASGVVAALLMLVLLEDRLAARNSRTVVLELGRIKCLLLRHARGCGVACCQHHNTHAQAHTQISANAGLHACTLAQHALRHAGMHTPHEHKPRKAAGGRTSVRQQALRWRDDQSIHRQAIVRLLSPRARGLTPLTLLPCWQERSAFMLVLRSTRADARA